MFKRRLFASALASAAVATLITSSSGAESSPEKGAILADIEAGQAMRLEYQIKASAWVLFIPISAKANFTADLNSDFYNIRGKVKTTGLADILVDYDLDVVSSGYVNPDELTTYAFVSQNNDGKKNRRVDLKVYRGDFEMTATPKFGNLGDPAATREQVIEAKDPITALISFALEPRAPGEDPCGGPIKVFDGRQLTHLHLKNAGKKTVKSQAWRGEAVECHITMDKVAGYKAGEVNRDTLTGIDGPLRVWLAPLSNGASIPVRIEAETERIGKVVLQAAKLNFIPIDAED
ncbi:MAG: DUF3108 domain-containing protein [Pseudomonadota bacterium]